MQGSKLLLILSLLVSTSSYALDIIEKTNPYTWTLSLNGSQHKASDYSKCSNQRDATLHNAYYWCPTSVGSLTAKQFANLTSSSSKPDSSTDSSTGSTGEVASGGSSNSNIIEKTNPNTWTLSLNGSKHQASNYSKCADMRDATLHNAYYWCPTSVGSLTTKQFADLTGSSSKPDSSTGGSTGSTPGTGTGTGTGTTYTAKLNWTPPSSREDGTALALSKLQGYEIYYTNDDLSMGLTVPVQGGSVTSLSIPSLKAGTYHFAISAIDTSGTKSALSPTVSVTYGGK